MGYAKDLNKNLNDIRIVSGQSIAQMEDVTKRANEAAKASFNLMKEKYANGKATSTEFNEARTNWLKAVSDRIQAKYDYLFRTKILDFYKGVPLTLE